MSPDRRPVVGRVGLTGRAALLAVVVCAVALTLAYPLRAYVAQRSHIAELRGGVAAQRAEVARLQAAHDRWADPAYVKAQAAGRLHYQMPGETLYVVLGPDDEGPVAGQRLRVATAPAPRPWFSDLWTSTRAADHE